MKQLPAFLDSIDWNRVAIGGAVIALYLFYTVEHDDNMRLRAQLAYEMGKAHALAGKKPCGCKGAASAPATPSVEEVA